MAFSYHDYTGDNSTTQFSIPFTYQNTSEISVTVDGVAQTGLTFPSSSTVQLTSAPASGTLVQVRRTTDLTARAVDFASGSVLTEEDLDDSSIQTFHASQEAIDRANDSIALDTDDKWDATSKVIKNVATPTANTDAANKSYVDTGANNAATSAAAALVSQNAAAASATAAANSATAAAGSATTAASEATDSANSATASASSATASANSAAAASTSESNAATSAATATTQAALATTNGAAQVSLATTQANNAAASATTASTQAANASSSASTAATQATNSATSATASSNSATAAANSATAAATSETNAANSAAAAAAAFDNFDDTYLGSKTSDPAVDNDGDPLTQGDLYFNSTANEMRVYDGANWIAASSAGAASLILYEYTATSGQTTFSGADDNAASLSYSVGNIQVVMNGVILDPSDYTATSGTSVVLATGAATGDLLNIYAFKSFTVADTVSASAGGTFSGNVSFTANATFGDNDKAIFGAGSDLEIYHNGTHSWIRDAGTGNLRLQGSNLQIQDSDGYSYIVCTDNGTGGEVSLRHNGSEKLATTSTGIDVTGSVTLDAAGNVTDGSGRPTVVLNNTSSGGWSTGTEYGSLEFHTDDTTSGAGLRAKISAKTGGTNGSRGVLGFTTRDSSGTTVETMTMTDTGVGIGTASPSAKIHLNESGSANAVQRIQAGTNGYAAQLHLYGNNVGGAAYNSVASYVNGDATPQWEITGPEASAEDQMLLHTGGSERLRIDSSGNLLVGKTSEDATTVGSTMRPNGGIVSVRDGDTNVVLNRKTSDGTIIDLRKDGSTVGSIGAKGGDLIIGTGDVGIRFNDANDALRPTDQSTGSGRDNAIDIGDSGNRFKDLYLSGGAYLGGTAAANHLDDYEEGSNTSATVRNSSGTVLTAGTDYSIETNKYTKIGRMVFGAVRLRDLRASKGDLEIDSPFTLDDGDRQYGVHFGGNDADSQVRGSATVASTRIRFRGAGEFKYGFYMAFTT